MKGHESRLSLTDLLCIGIGGTVGSGVFVLTGDVFPVAGPSAALCWIVGACVCVLSALSYAELAVRVPTRGSTYAYSYHALGEFAAVAGATSLTLEYGLSGAGVARSWSLKFAELVGGSWEFARYEGGGAKTGGDLYLDYDAALMQMLCVAVVAGGISLSKRVINVFTVAKIALVLFMIAAGFSAGRVDVFESTATFFPRGVSGVTQGTSLLFFGFIGFDEVCCMAARAENPRKTLPRAIFGTLLGAAGLSMVAQLALSTMVEFDADANDDNNTASFEVAFRRKGWKWAKYVTQVGEVVLLPLVVLLSFLPQPELMAALGDDGIAPAIFSKRSGPRGEFLHGCLVCGAVLTAISLVVPFSVLWNMINLGVLVGFNLSNASLISVRCGNGGALRDPVANRLLARYCMVLAPAAAYVLWKGCLGPALAFEKGSGSLLAPAHRALALVLGLALLSGAAWTAREIAPHARRDDDDNDGEGPQFRAPGVPWLPCLGIFLNFLLMAQYDWTDHAYVAALYAAAYATYFATKLSRSARRAELHSLDAAFTNNPLLADDPLARAKAPLLFDESSPGSRHTDTPTETL